MSRVYTNFETNLPESVQGVPTVELDYIAFEKDGKTLSIEGCELDFGVSDRKYDARLKGLEIIVERPDGETLSHKGITDEDISFLEGSTLSELGFYIPDDKDGNPVFEDDISATNVAVEVLHEDKTYTYTANDVRTMICN